MIRHFVVVDTLVVYHHRVIVFVACVTEVNVVQNFIDNQSLRQNVTLFISANGWVHLVNSENGSSLSISPIIILVALLIANNHKVCQVILKVGGHLAVDQLKFSRIISWCFCLIFQSISSMIRQILEFLLGVTIDIFHSIHRELINDESVHVWLVIVIFLSKSIFFALLCLNLNLWVRRFDVEIV